MLEDSYSNNFFNLVQIQPKHFLVFPDKSSRGKSSSKAYISIRNISKLPIVCRVVQKKDDFVLTIKVRPFMLLLMPNEEKKIEVLNDSDKAPTLRNSLIIEIIEYKNDINEFSPNQQDLFNKGKETYEFKLYQTNLMNIIGYQFQFDQIESKVNKLENDILKWLDYESEAKINKRTIVTFLFIVPLLVLVEKYFLNINLIYKKLSSWYT